ncbi:NAD(P)-dependent oxidoreductase [Amnibacterium endophyticum]|uniref:NAD(P)-dependent oxidoreductase n=1 Tax=Amnibacterium endophyticum TaxID=2109337 RepID=A0ABW4LGE4_9MICO
MRIAVLGSTGPTGRELVAQGLASGHEVVAIARRPEAWSELRDARLEVARGDVEDPASIARAVEGTDVLVSALGLSRAQAPGVLTAGARAVLAAAPARVIWLGSLGGNPSAEVAGPVWPGLMRIVLRREMPDKNRADVLLLDGGATLVHAGPLTKGASSAAAEVVPLDELRRRILPRAISRADVAAAMLKEAADARYPGQVVVPVAR